MALWRLRGQQRERTGPSLGRVSGRGRAASLPQAARRLFSRMMEVFAGFLMHSGHQAGRLIEFLPQFGELDNT